MSCQCIPITRKKRAYQSSVVIEEPVDDCTSDIPSYDTSGYCCWYYAAGYYDKCTHIGNNATCSDVSNGCIECQINCDTDAVSYCTIPCGSACYTQKCETKILPYEPCKKPSCNPNHKCILYVIQDKNIDDAIENMSPCNPCGVPLYQYYKGKFGDDDPNSTKYWLCYCLGNGKKC